MTLRPLLLAGLLVLLTLLARGGASKPPRAGAKRVQAPGEPAAVHEVPRGPDAEPVRAAPVPPAEDPLARIRRSTDERERVDLCARLGEDPGIEARWELLARVEAEAPAVREAAARALWPSREDPEVRLALERRIRIDPVKNVRVAAARALGR